MAAPNKSSSNNSEQRSSAAEQFPLGPETAEELGAWPRYYAEKAARDGMLLNLQRLFRHGALGVSEFSGWDAQREAWRVLAPSLSQACPGGIAPLQWVRSCDNGTIQQFVLKALSHGEACVFPDLLSRLPAEARDWLDANQVPKETLRSLTKEERSTMLTRHNANIASFVEKNRGWMFIAESFCAWWRQRNMAVDEPLAHRPFVLNNGTPPCVDYSPLNTKGNKFDAGRCEALQHVWLGERLTSGDLEKEDAFATEEVCQYPIVKKQVDSLKSHTIRYVRAHPDGEGVPSNRHRLNAYACNNRTSVWTGPEQEHFQERLQLFRNRTCEF